jgi:hypothetical protein
MPSDSEFINKEYKDSFKPSEEIRIVPYNGIAERPFPLREADYIKLTSKGAFPSISYTIIGLILAQLVSIIKICIENNLKSIPRSDIIVIIILFLLLGITFFFGHMLNREKRDINNLVKSHFKENRPDIEAQRITYGRNK